MKPGQSPNEHTKRKNEKVSTPKTKVQVRGDSGNRGKANQQSPSGFKPAVKPVSPTQATPKTHAGSKPGAAAVPTKAPERGPAPKKKFTHAKANDPEGLFGLIGKRINDETQLNQLLDHPKVKKGDVEALLVAREGISGKEVLQILNQAKVKNAEEALALLSTQKNASVEGLLKLLAHKKVLQAEDVPNLLQVRDEVSVDGLLELLDSNVKNPSQLEELLSPKYGAIDELKKFLIDPWKFQGNDLELVFAAGINSPNLLAFLDTKKLKTGQELGELMALRKNIPAKISDNSQMLKLLQRKELTSAEQLAILLSMPKGVQDADQLLAILDTGKLADAGKITGLLGTKKLEGPQLLDLCSNDKLISGDDLERLLANKKIADGAQILSLFETGKADSTQLIDLCSNVKLENGVKLLSLLKRDNLVDASQLIDLLNLDDGALKSGTQLDEILGHTTLVGVADVPAWLLNKRATGEQLLAILGKKIQTKSLVSLLDAPKLDSAADLVKLLDITRPVKKIAAFHANDLVTLVGVDRLENSSRLIEIVEQIEVLNPPLGKPVPCVRELLSDKNGWLTDGAQLLSILKHKKLRDANDVMRIFDLNKGMTGADLVTLLNRDRIPSCKGLLTLLNRADVVNSDTLIEWSNNNDKFLVDIKFPNNVNESAHYQAPRDQQHGKAQIALRFADADGSITSQLFRKHMNLKHEGKLVTSFPMTNGGFLVVVTYARFATRKKNKPEEFNDDSWLTYDTSYMSKDGAARGDSSAKYFSPEKKIDADP